MALAVLSGLLVVPDLVRTAVVMGVSTEPLLGAVEPEAQERQSMTTSVRSSGARSTKSSSAKGFSAEGSSTKGVAGRVEDGGAGAASSGYSVMVDSTGSRSDQPESLEQDMSLRARSAEADLWSIDGVLAYMGAQDLTIVDAGCFGGTSRSHWGYFVPGKSKYTEPGGQVIRGELDICINFSSGHPVDTLKHEVGHWWDYRHGWSLARAVGGDKEQAAECVARYLGASVFGGPGCRDDRAYNSVKALLDAGLR